MAAERDASWLKGIGRIVVAERDKAFCLSIAEMFARKGYEVLQAQDGEALCDALMKDRAALLLLDLDLADRKGSNLLARIREQTPALPVIVMVNGSPPEKLGEALRLGALDFVRKPFSLEDLVWRVKRHLPAHTGRYRHTKIAGRGEDILWSPATQDIRQALERAASSVATVLITGETGTGKEVAARMLHASSRGREKELFSVNCAALSPTLLESELFGHEKGAFTSATSQRTGRFEMADRGTLLLDEIGELSLPLQAKLLRVLQDREFERVGSSRTLKVDVRVIATTNRNLHEEVKEGRFRADLFYRLDVLHVEMPPLRERREEILLFVEYFARRKGHTLRMRPSVIDFLSRYEWPGNVRELENLVERWMTMERGETIEFDQIPLRIRGASMLASSAGVGSEDLSLAGAEIRQIMLVLERANGNLSLAAKVLGINRGTLRAKMVKLGLEGSATRIRVT